MRPCAPDQKPTPEKPCRGDPCPPGEPCGPASTCTPENPCKPHKPDFCDENSDGTMTCSPPPECQGKDARGACAPPPWCKPTDGGRYHCSEPAHPAGGPAMHGEPCGPPPRENDSKAPTPCGPMPPPAYEPVCRPGPDGAGVRCEPPPECGGAAFGGAGQRGCVPPPFCTVADDGLYDCKPPEDCRVGPDGASRCGPAPVGASCQKHLKETAANGSFVACAPPPAAFCPPPAPGQDAQVDRCRAPPPAPRPCAPGENPFPQDHPTNAPPLCIVQGHVEAGKYRPPADALHGSCAMPPPGEWPPAQHAPEGTVWCPPPGFAPPPAGDDMPAWQDFAKEHAPEAMRGFVAKQAAQWAKVDASSLEELNKAGLTHQLLAPPAFDGRAIAGSFVKSQVDDKLGLQNYSVGGAKFFKHARPDNAENVSFSTSVGPSVVAAAGKASVQSHNVPSGLLSYHASEGAYNVTFQPEPSDTLDVQDGLVVMKKGDWKGVLIGDTRLNDDGSLNVAVDAKRGAFFMAVPPGGVEGDTRLGIAHGVAKGKVFGEVSLLKRNDSLAQDLAFYDDGNHFDIEVGNTSSDKVELTFSGEGKPKAIVTTVDRTTLTTPLSEFAVTMDGATMRECLTFEELLESAANGGCYHLAVNETIVRVSVMPEHFSTHTIVMGEPDIAQAPVETPDTPIQTEKAPGTETETTDDATERPEGAPAAAEAGKETPGFAFGGALMALGGVGLALARRRRA